MASFHEISVATKMALLRIWLVASALWVSYVLLVVMLGRAHDSIGVMLALGCGPPAAVFIAFHVIKWGLRPFMPAQGDDVPQALRDADFARRLGIHEKLSLLGTVLSWLLALCLFVGWPLYGVYHLWVMPDATKEDAALWVWAPYFLGWLLWYPLRWIGRAFLAWVVATPPR